MPQPDGRDLAGLERLRFQLKIVENCVFSTLGGAVA
jgi:hypothetical protein